MPFSVSASTQEWELPESLEALDPRSAPNAGAASCLPPALLADLTEIESIGGMGHLKGVRVLLCCCAAGGGVLLGSLFFYVLPHHAPVPVCCTAPCACGRACVMYCSTCMCNCAVLRALRNTMFQSGCVRMCFQICVQYLLRSCGQLAWPTHTASTAHSKHGCLKHDRHMITDLV